MLPGSVEVSELGLLLLCVLGLLAVRGEGEEQTHKRCLGCNWTVQQVNHLRTQLYWWRTEDPVSRNVHREERSVKSCTYNHREG